MMTKIQKHYENDIVSNFFQDSNTQLTNIDSQVEGLDNIDIETIADLIQEEYQETPKEYMSNNERLNSLKEIINSQILTKEEEINLLKKAHNQDTEARNILIEKNLRLVMWTANEIYSKYRLNHLSLNDLIQEGIIGLIKAIDKFDTEKDYKLSGYAVTSIKRHIVQAIEFQEKTIRIPSDELHRVYNYRENFATLTQGMNGMPTREELAQKMHTTVSEIKELEQVPYSTISTDRPIKKDEYNEMFEEQENVEIQSIIPGNDIPIDEQIIQKEFLRELEKCLKESNLSKYELDCFTSYHLKGFTLSKIAKKYGVTAQRINQIIKRAFHKVISSENISKLAIYLEDPNQSIENLEKFVQENIPKAQKEQQYREAATQYLKKYPHKTINDIKPNTVIILNNCKKRIYIGRRLCKIREIIENNQENGLSEEQYEYWVHKMGLSVSPKTEKTPIIQQNELHSMLEIKKLSQQLPLSFEAYLQIRSLLKQIDLNNLREGIQAKKVTLKMSEKEQITKKELLELIKHTFLTAKFVMANNPESAYVKRKAIKTPR